MSRQNARFYTLDGGRIVTKSERVSYSTHAHGNTCNSATPPRQRPIQGHLRFLAPIYLQKKNVFFLPSNDSSGLFGFIPYREVSRFFYSPSLSQCSVGHITSDSALFIRIYITARVVCMVSRRSLRHSIFTGPRSRGDHWYETGGGFRGKG